MSKNSRTNWIMRLTSQGGILVFFIIGFEIIIMISPFAFFFYSVFNPVFRFIDQYPALSWLTSFYFTHMILPPTKLLVVIRVIGSVFFIAGFLLFIVCALQVYLGKIFKWGIAEKGIYKVIRHPQYLALAIWGIGMCILWPRFIVLVSLSIMFVVYYFLAKDEEGRMTVRYGESYQDYMRKTGMFFPLFIDKWFARLIPGERSRKIIIPVATVVIVLCAGFGLRALTLNSFTYTVRQNITVVTILPEDNQYCEKVLEGVENSLTYAKDSLLSHKKDYLGYLMPPDYIMQGMIANTGSDFHLFKMHNTSMMITEWVLHPFSHLRNSPALHMAKMHHVSPVYARRHHCPLGINDSTMQCANCPYKRLILVLIDHPGDNHFTKDQLFSFQVKRTPVCFIDINVYTGEIVNIQAVSKNTAWEDVPTPGI